MFSCGSRDRNILLNTTAIKYDECCDWLALREHRKGPKYLGGLRRSLKKIKLNWDLKCEKELVWIKEKGSNLERKMILLH